MRQVGRLALGGLLLALAAGCTGSSQAARVNASAAPAAASPAGRYCGTARSAAHVPVIIQAAHGVDCPVALRIQARYSKELDAGQAPGNGGGGPVPVEGWICEGYPTPQVLRTGRASECHKGALRFFAVLPAPSATATP
ncbi:MAG: hypothetical protein ACM3ML_07000 [Micromonosporaceae bacterium]